MSNCYSSMYDLFSYSKEHDCEDLINKAIPMFVADNKDAHLTLENKDMYEEFIGANYDELVKAWNGGDVSREDFENVVNSLAAIDDENTEEA